MPPEVAAATAATPPRLAAVGLRVRYGDREVLQGLSFEVAPGEIFGLLGPNGAGKTTAFQALAGLVPCDAGAVLLDGETLRMGDRRLRQRLGIVFQQPSLDTRLTARENLLLGAGLYRVPRAIARERAQRLLALVDLADRAGDAVKTFSGGMRRRLEICRALVHDPEILVMDEPTSGLDQAGFERIWDRLSELREARGLTLLVTTHRPEEAERCDRLALLCDGRAVACDTPERLKAQVSGDVVVLDASDPPGAAARVRAEFGLEARIADGLVFLEREAGHELIPRLVEAFPPGHLRSVNLHRPSLADVFLHFTGRALDKGVPV
jgi:ABC-2 type transport system ATP-binding protein